MPSNPTLNERLATLRRILADQGSREAVQDLDDAINHMDQLTKVVEELVEDINTAGGIVTGDNNRAWPATDPGWTDLAVTYRHACQALGVRPQSKKAIT